MIDKPKGIVLVSTKEKENRSEVDQSFIYRLQIVVSSDESKNFNLFWIGLTIPECDDVTVANDEYLFHDFSIVGVGDFGHIGSTNRMTINRYSPRACASCTNN